MSVIQHHLSNLFCVENLTQFHVLLILMTSFLLQAPLWRTFRISILLSSGHPCLSEIIIRNIIEFFLNNTNLTFLAFLYKIYIMGFQNQQKNLPPLGIELPTPTPLLEFQLPYPLSQSASPCQSQTFKPL